MKHLFIILSIVLATISYKVVNIPTSKIKEFRVENGKYFVILKDKKEYQLINKEQYTAIVKSIYYIDTLNSRAKYLENFWNIVYFEKIYTML